jgi:hypothetical protein
MVVVLNCPLTIQLLAHVNSSVRTGCTIKHHIAQDIRRRGTHVLPRSDEAHCVPGVLIQRMPLRVTDIAGIKDRLGVLDAVSID